MMDFGTLRKQARAIDKTSFRKIKVAVLGNYATQFLSKSIEYSGVKASYNFDLYNADYNQIESEILDPTSGLYAFEPDYTIISLSSFKLLDKYYSRSGEARQSFAEDYSTYFRNLIGTLLSQSSTKIIVNNIEILNDQVYGSLFAKVKQSFTFQSYLLNASLLEMSNTTDNLYLFDLNGLIQYHGAKNIRDWQQHINADMPYSLDFLAIISEYVTAFISAFAGTFKKCIIVDLDDTLWGGIIGDDGVEGIRVGTLGIGRAFSDFQRWLKELKERGIILAVCSKNEEKTAKEPFLSHPEMVLKLEDIAVFVANWENKADNIRSIQEILNIGFDSMVFLDDNPAEREIVRQNIPQITVPELPNDPALYLDFLINLRLFETASLSSGDKDRTAQYQQEAERQKLRFSITNMDEYLKSLGIEMTIESFQTLDIPRIAQLSQRSNQFNLRTVRYSESDIRKIIADQSYYTISLKLRDKFGDYGLVSLITLRTTDSNNLFIENWIMSCRVLKRGVENAVLDHIKGIALKNGYKLIIGEYIPSSKNVLVKDHYKNLGFTQSEDVWHLQTGAQD